MEERKRGNGPREGKHAACPIPPSLPLDPFSCLSSTFPPLHASKRTNPPPPLLPPSNAVLVCLTRTKIKQFKFILMLPNYTEQRILIGCGPLARPKEQQQKGPPVRSTAPCAVEDGGIGLRRLRPLALGRRMGEIRLLASQIACSPIWRKRRMGQEGWGGGIHG